MSGTTTIPLCRRRLRPLAVSVALVLLLVPAVGLAAPGDLDSGFGASGQARLSGDGGKDLALQDGKILVTNGLGVARLLATGVVDPSFKLQEHPLQACEPDGLGLQQKGQIIIGGCSSSPLGIDFAVERRGKDGVIDPTFGNGGIVSTDFGPEDYLEDLLVQPDDKIVAVGTSVLENTESIFRAQWVIARYRADGTLDQSFGSAGKVVSTFAAGFCGEAFKAALQADGKILVVGARCSSSDVNVSDMVVRRFLPSGAVDTSFGVSGTRLVDLGAFDVAESLALQSDGKIVVVGRSTPEFYATGADFLALRLDNAGTQDTSFGNAGIATIASEDPDIAEDVVLQSDGKIVVVGSHISYSSYFPDAIDRFVVERFTPSGQPDVTFGTGGRVETWMSGPRGYEESNAKAVLITPDGKLLVSGGMFQYNGFDEEPSYYTIVARYSAVASGPACTIIGTTGADHITGTQFDDVICPGDGNDVVEAGSGNDIVRGGKGDDTIFGGAGRDQLFGEAGNDRIVGAADPDILDGGAGGDTLEAKDSMPGDSVNGGAGVDVCVADPGDTQTSCP